MKSDVDDDLLDSKSSDCMGLFNSVFGGSGPVILRFCLPDGDDRRFVLHIALPLAVAISVSEADETNPPFSFFFFLFQFF